MLPIGEEVELRRRRPFVTIALLAVMLGLWLALSGPGRETEFSELVRAYGLVPNRFWADPEGGWLTLLTSAFLHGGIGHLAANLLFLWVFGRGLEHELGWGFLPLYLACAVGGGLASVLVRASSDTPAIGASGAISGLLGAYLVLLPNAQIRAVVLVPWLAVAAILRGDKPIWEAPAWAGILTWLALQLMMALAPRELRSNVDYAAHVGGFLTGYLMIRIARAAFGLWPDEPAYERILDRPVGLAVPRPDSYVRAARLIPAGTTIVIADLEWVSREGGYVDPDVVPGFEGKALIGRRMRETRYRYEPIRWQDLEAAGALSEGVNAAS